MSHESPKPARRPSQGPSIPTPLGDQLSQDTGIWPAEQPAAQEPLAHEEFPVVNGVKESEFPQDPDLSAFFAGEIPPALIPTKKVPNFGRILLWIMILSILVFTVNDIFTAWLVHFFK